MLVRITWIWQVFKFCVTKDAFVTVNLPYSMFVTEGASFYSHATKICGGANVMIRIVQANYGTNYKKNVGKCKKFQNQMAYSSHKNHIISVKFISILYRQSASLNTFVKTSRFVDLNLWSNHGHFEEPIKNPNASLTIRKVFWDN